MWIHREDSKIEGILVHNLNLIVGMLGGMIGI